MNKSLILKEIKKHYNFNTDAEFARFLEITPQNLAQWYVRNTYDIHILAAKCNEINRDWLLDGEGDMLKKDVTAVIGDPNVISLPIDAWELIKNQAESLKTKDRQIDNMLDSLKTKDEQTTEVIQMLKEQLKKGQGS